MQMDSVLLENRSEYSSHSQSPIQPTLTSIKQTKSTPFQLNFAYHVIKLNWIVKFTYFPYFTII